MAAKKKSEKSWGRRLLMAAWGLLFIAIAAAAGLAYFLPPLGPLPQEQSEEQGEDMSSLAGTPEPTGDHAEADKTGEMTAESDATDSEATAETAPSEEMATSEEEEVKAEEPVVETSNDPAESSDPAAMAPVMAAEEDTQQDAETSKMTEAASAEAEKAETAGTEEPEMADPSGSPDNNQSTDTQMAAHPAPTAPEPAAQPKQAEPPADIRPTWQKFAQPFKAHPSKPKIAIVVYSLGLSNKTTERAIRQLPSEVTLSFSPYARKLQAWVSLARARGHEAMMDLPLEPVGYPASDPGHFALLTSSSVEENLKRLANVVDSSSAFVGLTAFMGSRFSSSSASMEPVVKGIADRGLLYLDNGQVTETVTKSLAPNYELAYLATDRILDGNSANRLTIDARLAQLERLALTTGRAIGLARPFPVTIERLKVWSKKLEAHGIQLVPITQMVPLYQAPAEIKGAPDPEQHNTSQNTDDLG